MSTENINEPITLTEVTKLDLETKPVKAKIEKPCNMKLTDLCKRDKVSILHGKYCIPCYKHKTAIRKELNKQHIDHEQFFDLFITDK